VSLLELTRVTRRYRRAQPAAVDGITLSVSRGEILALLGPSGSGKTTLLRLIAGFEAPDAGSVAIAGRVVAGAGVVVPPEARGVGIVFQDYALFPHLTVEGNVAFGLHAVDAARRRERVRELLALVGLPLFAYRYPHELSGGQQQLVALARALAPAPAVLLLDEPFSNLDADLRGEMRAQVQTILKATGTTVVFVTHGQDEAFAIADRVGVLHRGRLEQLDRPETIYHRPATPFVAEFVGAATFIPGVVDAAGIVTDVGTFPADGVGPPGTTVEVMIRPDDVTFVQSPDGDALLIERDFRGTETVYCLELPGGRRLYSSQASWATDAVGDRVRVAVHLEHLVTFPRRSRSDPGSPGRDERGGV
jgi:iron(III) transport system ATP-binding protein